MNDSNNAASFLLSSKVAGILGGILTFIGLSLSCMSLSIATTEAGQPDGDPISWLLGFACLALPTVAAGLLGLFYAYRTHRQQSERRLHKTILDLASANGDNSVTAGKLALNSELSLNEAQDLLEEMTTRGMCRMDIRDDGMTWFSFE